jgi:hypothetical protein
MSAVLKGNVEGKPSFVNGKGAFMALGLVGGALLWLFLAFGIGDAHKYMLNSFMYGYIFWLMVTLGCLGLSLLHNSIKSSWTLATLRIFEAGSSIYMWGALAFFMIPVVMHIGHVYEWADPAHIDFIIKKKQPYLNVPFFVIRLGVYFTVFAFMAHFLRKSTNRQDKTQDPVEFQKRTNFATPMMVLFFILETFMLTDLGMSLTPHWYSTIYGVWMLIGGAQAALSLGTLLVCSNAKKDAYNHAMSPALTKDLGNMMFVLTMLWAYTSVSQLIILWNGNLPETTTFYAHRGVDAGLGWNAVGASTIIGCFIVPFVTLLSPRVKRYPERLAKIAGWIFVFRIVDVFWIIGAAVPHRSHNLAVPTFYDVAGWLVMGLVWFAVMTRTVEQAPLIPTYDKRLEEAKANAH